MLAYYRRRRRGGKIILGLSALCLLYVIGAGILELQNGRLICEKQGKQEQLNDASVEPDVAWMKAREELLSTVPKYGLSKVVLYSYMRGGSTLFSHVFNIDPQPAILWYEALDAFHVHYSGMPYYSNPLRLLYHSNQTRRSLDKNKRIAMTDYLESLLNCKPYEVPLETLSHRFIAVSKALKEFWDCMKSLQVTMFRLIRLIPSSACQAIEFDPDSDLRILRCSEVFQFLRGLQAEQLFREDKTVNLLLSYFDQLEGSEQLSSVLETCGKLWNEQSESGNDMEFLYEGTGDYDYVFQTTAATTTTKPSEQEQRCSTVQKRFSEFFNAAYYTRFLNDYATPCRNILRSSCAKSRIVVAGVHRASLSDLELLIRRMPEVSLIFYVRDPRAVAVSRADPLTMLTYLNSSDWTAVNESEFLCRRMWDDLEAKERLEKRYPGSILTVRYEDLLLDPRRTVTRAYDQILRRVPAGLDRWINKTLNAGTYDGIFGIRRRNSMEHISKWRSKVSVDEGREMTQHCLRVLQYFDYQI